MRLLFLIMSPILEIVVQQKETAYRIWGGIVVIPAPHIAACEKCTENLA